MGKVMVYIIHDPKADEGVRQVLMEMGIDIYTRFRNSLDAMAGLADCQTDANGPHNVTIAVIEDTEKTGLMTKLKQLQVDLPFSGLRAFVVSVLDMI